MNEITNLTIEFRSYMTAAEADHQKTGSKGGTVAQDLNI